MKNRSLFKPSLLAGAALAATMATSSAFAGAAFTVNQSTVPGSAGAANVVADSINFSYKALIASQVNGGYTSGAAVGNTSKLAGNDDQFVETGYMSLNGFTLSQNGVTSLLNGSEPAGYKLYALFTIHGEANPVSGSNTSVNAQFSSASLSLWLDSGSDTALGLTGSNGSAAYTVNAVTADTKLADMTLNVGEANVKPGSVPGVSPGDFGVMFDAVWTPAGNNFFNGQTSTLLQQMIFSGTTSTFKLNSAPNAAGNNYANLLNGGTTIVEGGGVVYLQDTAVPEPSSALLAGLGLVGLVATSRRRNKKA